jgi:hypothetical protein
MFTGIFLCDIRFYVPSPWLLHVVALAQAFIPYLSGLYDSRMEIAILDFLMQYIYHIITTCREPI